MNGQNQGQESRIKGSGASALRASATDGASPLRGSEKKGSRAGKDGNRRIEGPPAGVA